MRWGFVVEGQPVSWNQGYEPGRRPRTGRWGRLRLGENGETIQRSTIVKTDKANAYTDLVMVRCRGKMPYRWKPTGYVVVELYYFLGRDIDCDNVMKFVDDAIQSATGVDDRWLLPRAMYKRFGLRPNQRKLVVVIDDSPDLSEFASLVLPA